MTQSTELGQYLYTLMQKLNWEPGTDLQIEIAGSVVSGIDPGENFNPKWSAPMGQMRYNKDAFIVIKSVERSKVVSSLSKEQQDKIADDKANYDTSGK